MTAGLTLPFVTEADPDTQQEGSLDPLGLARIADLLADEIAPQVTARMSRVRFLTAIAACSSVTEEPADILSADGIPAYLAFEWLVVEAMVRKSPTSGTDAVPGIQKARRRLRTEWGSHLDAGSYLQTPKVFGFHGVYKRLARDLEIVDDALGLLPAGEKLLETWERGLGLEGFTLKRRGTKGGKLARRLGDEVGKALAAGAVRLGYSSAMWRDIAAAFAPGDAPRSERQLVWKWLTSTRRPVQDELQARLAAER